MRVILGWTRPGAGGLRRFQY